jgi:hypothetical protein
MKLENYYLCCTVQNLPSSINIPNSNLLKSLGNKDISHKNNPIRHYNKTLIQHNFGSEVGRNIENITEN